MNLIELSQKIGLPPETVREILRSRCHRIVLHELAPVNAEAEAELLAAYGHSPPPATHPEKQQDFPRRHVSDNTHREAETIQFLRRCDAQGYHVLIDTCSLLHPGFFHFYQFYCNAATHPLYIPYVVQLELEKKLHDSRLHAQARRVLELIRCDDRITVLGDEKDLRRNDHGEKRVHADPVFIEKLTFLRNSGVNVLLLTQDKALTGDLLNINKLRCRSTKAVIIVKKLTPDGILAAPL